MNLAPTNPMGFSKRAHLTPQRPIWLSASNISFFFVVALICNLTLPSDAQPQDENWIVWVSPSGPNNSSACGTTREKACSIAAASMLMVENVAFLGDWTILLTSGDHILPHELAFESRRHLKIQTADSEPHIANIIQGSEQGMLATFGQRIVFKRLRLAGFVLGVLSTITVGATESLLVQDCHWENNAKYSAPFAAAISVAGKSNTTFINCTWTNNTGFSPAAGDAESIPPFGSALSWELYGSNISPVMNLALINCTFTDNGQRPLKAPGKLTGGAVSILTSRNLWDSVDLFIISIENSRFNGNYVSVDAQELSIFATAAPFVRGGAMCIITGCRTSLRITNSRFEGNYLTLSNMKSLASYGGAIDLEMTHPESDAIIEGSLFRGNHAFGGKGTSNDLSAGLCMGGAISATLASPLVLRNCYFEGNHCDGPAGGLFAGYSQGGAVSYQAPLFTSNSDSKLGLLIESSTFVGNRVRGTLAEDGFGTANGGAVFFTIPSADRLSILSVSSSSFLDNYAFVPCGSVKGGAVSINLQLAPTGVITSPAPILFEYSNFSDNRVQSECAGQLKEELDGKGGAIFIRLPPRLSSYVSFTRSNFTSNFAHSSVSAGGAIAVDLALPVSAGRFEANVLDCSFVSNYALGNGFAQGGAISALSRRAMSTDRSVLAVQRSSFTGNSVQCRSPNGVDSGLPCMGGAISSDSMLSNISLSLFAWNKVGPPESIPSRPCGVSSGGAIAALSPSDFLIVQDSIFESNVVQDPLSAGGGIHCGEASLQNCTFNNNLALGEVRALGGSLAFQDFVEIKDVRIFNSSAIILDDIKSCSSPTGMAAMDISPADSCGGAVAFTGSVSFDITELLIFNSSAAYGGSIFFGSPDFRRRMKMQDSTLRLSRASKAGGSAFIYSTIYNASVVPTLCEGFASGNTSAGLFGPVCASSPTVFQPSLQLPTFVAPGQKFAIMLELVDAFENIVVDPTISVRADLVHGSPPGVVSIRSGKPQNTVFNDKGAFVYEAFAILGRPNATAVVSFMTDARMLSPFSFSLPHVITTRFEVLSCLPSHFQSAEDPDSVDVTCAICPAQTYLFSSGGVQQCVECPEKPHHGGEEGGPHEEEHYSCLNPPELAITELHHHDHVEAPQWIISAGFYPVPSLEAPTELLACPNHACKQFECSISVSNGSAWLLNCSACPTHEPNAHSSFASDHLSDCHCKTGYADRLCSRCLCDSDICYFMGGEPEMRHCTLCRQHSTVVIISAIIALQISLIVFLLFKRSAIALLLAEATIAITLFLLGVGEAWLLDLVIMLALLFVITSLSQRLPRQQHVRSPLDHETDDESNDEHGMDSHHHHEHHIAAKTAAIAKITIFFLQSAASLVKPAAWPTWISFVISQLDALNFRVSGLECFAPSLLANPVGKLAFQLGMPLIVGANIVVAACISAIIIKIRPVYHVKRLIAACCKAKQKPAKRGIPDALDSSDESDRLFIESKKSDDADTEADEPLLHEKANEGEAPSWSLSDLIARVQFSCLFLLSTSYFELTNVILEVLRPCHKGYMANFPWIPCGFNNPLFTSLVAIAINCLFLYTVGIPLFFGIIMFLNRRRIRAGDPNMENRFGFLFESYRQEVFWWELVWFLRRILLSVAISTLVAQPGYQMALILIVLLATLFLHRSVKPFADRSANLLELFATACLIFAVVMGSEIQQYRKDDTGSMTPVLQNSVWALIALTTVLLVSTLVLPAVQSVVRLLRHKLRKD